MKRIGSVICLCLFLMLSVPPACAEPFFSVSVRKAENAMTADRIEQERQEQWEAYQEQMLENAEMISQLDASALTYGEVTMRYDLQVIGDMPEGGYPLYIALHGGGSSDTPDSNDAEWANMWGYYSTDLECGIYVAVRGVRDTWDTHFNPESYPLYDKLIRYLLLAYDINPNRVYLEGFSAGGDGVYAISCRMPDRFAAVNMSSGHPNGISLLNLFRLPIQLQAGEFDTAYDRHRVTAEYGLLLDELEAQFGYFEHRTLIHYDCGHNYDDSFRTPLPVMSDVALWLEQGDRSHEDVDSFPPDYMDAFERDPLPSPVLWDLTTRADTRETEANYYLSAPYATNQGSLFVSYDREANVLTVETQGVNGEFSILLNEKMVRFDAPVVFRVNGDETTLDIVPDRLVLLETTWDRGDPNYQFEAVVTLTPQE